MPSAIWRYVTVVAINSAISVANWSTTSAWRTLACAPPVRDDFVTVAARNDDSTSEGYTPASRPTSTRKPSVTAATRQSANIEKSIVRRRNVLSGCSAAAATPSPSTDPAIT